MSRKYVTENITYIKSHWWKIRYSVGTCLNDWTDKLKHKTLALYRKAHAIDSPLDGTKSSKLKSMHVCRPCNKLFKPSFILYHWLLTRIRFSAKHCQVVCIAVRMHIYQFLRIYLNQRIRAEIIFIVFKSITLVGGIYNRKTIFEFV